MSSTQFHVERPWGLNSVLNVKAVVAAFNQEKALVGAFSVITNLRMDLLKHLVFSVPGARENLHLQSFDGPDRVSKY